MLESLSTTYSLLFDVMAEIYFLYCWSLALQNLFQSQLSQETQAGLNCPGNGFLWKEGKWRVSIVSTWVFTKFAKESEDALGMY